MLAVIAIGAPVLFAIAIGASVLLLIPSLIAAITGKE